MARKIHSRLRIAGTFVAETPLHVGGFGESVDTDLPLAQNGKDEWYVPGTSIAGVLRSWCEQNFGHLPFQATKTLLEELFGFQKANKGHASFVLIEDATIEKADQVLTEIRDGVGIDRYYGVAADKAKFDRAILPRGTKLNFQMTVELGEDHDANQIKAVVGNLLEALTQSKIRFGAARTRGLGRVKLIGNRKENDAYKDKPEIKEQSLLGFENILKLLNGNGDSRTIEDLKGAASLSTNSAPQLEIIIHWRPRLPVMVKAGYDGIGVDTLPLTSGVGKDKLALCLPGSSIKGAMRSHAERIVRTVLDCDAAQNKYKTRGRDFHDQIDSLPLIEDLFGAKNKPGNTKGLGALVIDDCYAKEAMAAKKWREVEVASDAKQKENAQDKADEVSYHLRELWRKLREIDIAMGIKPKDEQHKYEEPTQKFRINHHVAIDRWTGGAAEGALYGALAPTKVEWEEMQLTLDFGRIEPESQLLALMLLLLTLRDMAENRLPFGFATNRGMGEIEVTSFSFVGSRSITAKKVEEENGAIVERDEDLTLDLNKLVAKVKNGRCLFDESDDILKEQLQLRWKKWLQ